jgi:predicted NBD/HSP70 family sugar kinase
VSSAGELLGMIRDGRAATRPDLAQLTGLSRSTIADRVRSLVAHDLLYEDGDASSTGGRPPRRLALNRDAVVLAADLRPGASRLAVGDLGGELCAERTVELAEPGDVSESLAALLASAGREPGAVWGVGLGLPARALRPDRPGEPLPPGWAAGSLTCRLSARFGTPVLTEVDVNVRALGEHWASWSHVEHLLYVDAGDGISCGIVAGRRVHRGAQALAGDIGHIRLDDRDDALCHCGNTGCLEAVAGGPALAARLRAAGLDAHDAAGVVQLAAAGEPLAVHAVRDAGRALGEVVSSAASFFNPGAIVIGGALSGAHDSLLAGVRETTSARLLPAVSRHLRLVHGHLGDRAGVLGAAVLAIEHLLAPESVDLLVAGGVSRPTAAERRRSA